MKRILEILISTMLIVFPIWGAGASLFMTLSGVVSLVVLFRNKSAFKGKLYWPFVAYLVLYVLGVSWSENVGDGWGAVQVRLGMVVLPLIAMASAQLHIGRKSLFQAMFVGFGVSLVFFGYDIYLHVKAGETFVESITGSQLCLPFAHRAYYMNYLAIIALGWSLLWKEMPKWYSWLFYGLVLLVFWILQGRMNILGLALVFGLMFILAVWKREKRMLWSSVVGLAFPLLLFVTDAVPTRFNQEQMSDELSMPSEGAPKELSRSFQMKSGWEVYRRNPFLGVGSGDVHKELNAYFEETGYTFGLERNYNVHNEYIQVLMTLGPLGLLSLFLLFAIPMRESWLQQDFIPLLWLVYFGLVMFTESYFDRFAGVFMFAAITSFLGATTKRV